MKTYSHIEPWKLPDSYFGATWDNWYVFLSRNRDSDILTESNFECGLREVESVASENEIADGSEDSEMATVQTVRENHWLCGWIEWIAIHKSDEKALEKANSILEMLESYPVLNESDFSEKEYECFQESWESYGFSEFKDELCNRIESEYCDSEEYEIDTILDTVRDEIDSAIETIASDASQLVSWQYQSEGSGVSINIEEMVEKSDVESAIDKAIEHIEEQNRIQEIEKLGAYLGACKAEIKQAVKMGFNRVSQFNQLMQGSI